MNSTKIVKIIYESSLIVFSVFLALFLNEYREQLKADQQKDRALQFVRIELTSNLQKLDEWLPYHEDMLNKLSQAITSDNQLSTFKSQNDFLTHIAPNGFIQEALSHSSWEAIKQSETSSAVSIEAIFSLSKLFQAQSTGVEATVSRIVEEFYSLQYDNTADFTKALTVIQFQLQELVSQEKYLIERYNQVLNNKALLT